MVRDRSARRDACQSKNLESIIAVVNAAGGKVFEAEYDAWGNQTVTRNDIRLSRGYRHYNLTLTCPVEKGLEPVYPEFEIITAARALFNGALKATFSVAADGCRFINEQRKPWIRIKTSYSQVNGVKTKSITWGQMHINLYRLRQ